MPQEGQEHPSHGVCQRDVHGAATLVASVESWLKLWIQGPESGVREGFSALSKPPWGWGRGVLLRAIS